VYVIALFCFLKAVHKKTHRTNDVRYNPIINQFTAVTDRCDHAVAVVADFGTVEMLLRALDERVRKQQVIFHAIFPRTKQYQVYCAVHSLHLKRKTPPPRQQNKNKSITGPWMMNYKEERP
jgi:hypothetical protein